MEPHGPASRTDDGDLSLLEPDEELLCSVNDIAEHLGRNIAAVLDSALAEIRRTVGVRIRILRMELQQKSAEVEVLKARLEGTSSASSGGSSGPPADAAPRKGDCSPTGKHGSVEPRRAKTSVVPGVKKENIDAICDYLMKDKNPHHQQQQQHEAEPDSLHLWAGGGAASSGPGSGEAGAGGPGAGDDLFGLLPSGSSKRLYDYEWIPPMAYSSELKVMKEPGCDSAPTGEADHHNDDEEEHTPPLLHVQASSDHLLLPTGHQLSPGQSEEGEGPPLRVSQDQAATGESYPLVSGGGGHTYICSLCGTFCPDSLFLEEHVKLIHPEQEEQQELRQEPQEQLRSMCCTESRRGGTGGAGASRGGPRGGGGGAGAGPLKKENKLEGGSYECGDCGRRFNYLGNLRQHRRIHTGEKPFQCPDCGERFRHAARLKSHRLVHTGDQSPFPCPQCGKGFSVLSGLKRHQRVHTGESPYSCPQCGRCFKELGNLYTHQRIHSGATPYCCHTCGRSFRHLGTFKSHRCTAPPH